jgi:hypothetical protein
LENSIQILQHIVVRKPEDFQASLRDPVCSLLIVLTSLVVRIAINFDNELSRMAEEIGDVRSDAMLSSESEAQELVAADRGPKLQLRGCEFFAHGARAADERLSEHLVGACSLCGHRF